LCLNRGKSEKEENRASVTILKTKWRRIVLGALFMSLSPAPGVQALAGNRVGDLYFYERERENGLVFLMKSPPTYTLRSKVQGEIVVVLKNAETSSVVLKRAARNSWPLQISREDNKNLKCVLKPSGEVREVKTAWLGDKNLFFLQFFLRRQSLVKAQPGVVLHPRLARLRFGVGKNYTRTVLALDTKPRWVFSFSPERGFNLELPGGRTTMKRRNYGPISRLRTVNINPLSNGLAVILRPKGVLPNSRLFWLDEGNRLVMDLLDKPDTTAVKAFTLPPGFGKEEKTPLLASKKIQTGEPWSAASGKEKPGLKEKPQKALSIGSERIPVPEETVAENPKPPPAKGGGPFLRRRIELPLKTLKTEGPADVKNPRKKGVIEGNPHRADIQIGRQLLALPLKTEEGQKLDPEEALAYGKIWKAQELKRFGEASTLIDQFLARFPLSVMSKELLFLKGDMLFSRLERGEKDLLSEVIEAYRQAINRSEESDRVIDGYMRMAKANSLTGNDIAAVSFLNLAVKHCKGCPNGARAYLERGRLLMKTGSPEKAVLDFKEVLARYPNSSLAASALFGIAQYLHKKGLYQNAETRLEQIAALDHDFRLKRPDFLSLWAQNLLFLKEYERSRDLFFKALNLDPRPEGKDLLLTHIGDTFLYQFRPKEAEKMYRQAVKEFPGSEGARIAELRLAELYFDVEAFKKVRDEKQEGMTGEISDLKIANAYYHGGRYKMAMDSLKELTSKPPQDAVTAAARELFRQAAEKSMDQLYRNAKFSGVVETFKANESLLKDRIDPDIQLLVAISLQKLQKYGDAVPAYEALNPFDVSLKMKGEYYLGLAKCYVETGNSEAVVKLMEDGRKGKLSEKDRQRVTYFLADWYKSKKEYGKAYDLFAELIRSKIDLSSEEMSQIYLALGEVLNKLGKYQKAKEYLYGSIALSERDSNSRRTYFLGLGSLGDSFLGEEKYGEALGQYQKAFDMGYGETLPQYWDFKLGQAEALMATGERDASSSLLSEVYDGNGPGKRYWVLKYRLAKGYLRAGKVEKAEAHLKEISEEGTPVLQTEAQLQLGSLLLQKNLKKLSIWPEIGGQRVQHARQ
jgi:tetratricopeptide (TPR) repeat protein